MSLYDRVRAALGLSDEQTEKLSVLEAAESDQELDDDTPVDQDTPDADTPADDSPDVTEQLTALEARAEAAEKDAKASATLLQAEIGKRRDAEREQLLDELSAGEKPVLVPAARALIEPVFRVLEESSEDVIVLKAEDGDVKLSPLEVLVEALRQNASIQARYFSSEVEIPAIDGETNPWSEDNFQSEDASTEE